MEAYKSLEQIRHQLEDMTKQKDDLDIETKGLRLKVKLQEDKLQVLVGVTEEKKSLQDKLGDLCIKLGEYERLEVEHAVLQENLKGTTNLLNERVFCCC